MSYSSAMRSVVSLVIAAFTLSACKSEPTGENQYALARAADRPGSRPRALGLYVLACDKGVAAACNDASALLTAGDEIPADEPRAFDLLDGACRGNALLACANISAKHRAVKDYVKATDAAERACIGNVGRGCTQLAMIAAEGSSWRVPKEVELPLLEKAIALGDPMAKTRLASKLISAKAELKRAEALLRDSCEEDGSACALLGHLYGGVSGFTKDPDRSRAAFEKGCTKDPYECNELAAQLGPSEEPRRRRLYEQACGAGNGTACLNLGSRFEAGQGVEQDSAQAKKLYERACRADEPKGCVSLGVLIQRQRTRGALSEAAALFRRACDAGEEGGCSRLPVDDGSGSGD